MAPQIFIGEGYGYVLTEHSKKTIRKFTTISGWLSIRQKAIEIDKRRKSIIKHRNDPY
ncbi:hypothetical protein L798_14479 [Zootermopsis nevadensis]|uniref:Uncharacterized protein n=1 Tax=Zootermopsis nevadensis TaxID=136037 RepID=A0A067QSG2_ZOONE|nr:hypothetical protein L798_14479 [Zootermopsis nevadensis]